LPGERRPRSAPFPVLGTFRERARSLPLRHTHRAAVQAPGGRSSQSVRQSAAETTTENCHPSKYRVLERCRKEFIYEVLQLLKLREHWRRGEE
ncbi:hypothetical protein LEMLEM_LOCUS15479, partial [Lemmus lemmus]